MPARAARTALSAASQAAEAGRAPIGKMASTPSPMNFSTSPPKACAAPAMRSNQASSTATTASGGVDSDNSVKPRRSAKRSTARMRSPVSRRDRPASTCAALRRPR